MIAYVTVGADDIDCAERFYSAFLPALGYGLERFQGDLSYVLPVQLGQSPILCQISTLNHPLMDVGPCLETVL